MYESLHVWQMARQNLSANANAAIYLYIKLPLAVLMTPHFISLQSSSLSV